MAREFTETQAIRNLQRYLRQLSFLDDNLPENPIDGVFDTETRQAVEMFQKNRGLPVTGEADRVTWDAIFAEYLRSVAATAKPNAVDIFFRRPVPTFIRIGDGGFHVAAIQYMLNEVFLFYGDTLQISTDGGYGQQTADGVRKFQRYVALPVTGEVDIETWNRLTSLYNELFREGNQ